MVIFSSMKNENTNTGIIVTLLFLSLIWGSSFILIKRGLVAFSPLQVGGLRIVFAGLVLLPVSLKNFSKYFRLYKWKFFLLGLISNMIPAILFSEAETGLTSSLAGVLNALTPVFTLMVSAFFFSAVIRRGQVFGLTFGLAGSILLAFAGNSGELGNFNIYALYVIIATICYGFGANIVKNFFVGVNPVIFTSMALFFMMPVAISILLLTGIENSFTHEYAVQSTIYIFILGSVGTSLALVIFNKLIQNTSPVFASTVTYLIPIAAIGWGVADGEPFELTHVASTFLIIIGVYFVNKYK